MSVRIAAVGDIHVGTDTHGRVASGLASLDGCADLLLLAGDLTRVGSEEEADCVVAELASVAVPVVAVLGNHDYHSDRAGHLVRRLEAASVQVLEGASMAIEVGDVRVGVAGVKGFGGGFAGRSGSAFGEEEMKAFIRTTAEAADSLEQGLDALDADIRVALMHYSPVPDTLEGEPREIYPFLGSYLFAEAIDRAGADLVVHGHAHRGSPRGVTPGGTKVRNVAQPVIGRPFCLFEFAVGANERRSGAPPRDTLVALPERR